MLYFFIFCNIFYVYVTKTYYLQHKMITLSSLFLEMDSQDRFLIKRLNLFNNSFRSHVERRRAAAVMRKIESHT